MFKSKVVTGLDIGRSSVKIAQIERRSDGLHLINWGMKEIPDISLADREEKILTIANVIREIISDKKMKISTLISVLPRELTAVRRLKIPSTDEDEIQKMVKFETERSLSLPLEEAEIDFQIIEQTSAPSSEILLVGVKKESIDYHLDVLRMARVKPEIVTLSSFALFNSYIYGREIEKTVALIDIGVESIEVNIAKDEALLFTTSIPIGVSLPNQEIKKEFEQLITEIKRSFEAFKAEPYGEEIERIVLSGGGSKEQGIEGRLKERLGVAVEIINPFQELKVSIPELNQDELAPFFPVAIGAALTGVLKESKGVNLLPERLRRERRVISKKVIKITSVLIVLLALLSFIFIVGRGLNQKEERLKRLDKELQVMRIEADKVQRVRLRLEAIKSYTSQERDCLEVLRELSLITPRDVYITNLLFEKDKSINITAQTQKHSTAVEFSNLLEKSSFFRNSQLKYSREREGPKVIEPYMKIPFITIERETESRKVIDFEVGAEIVEEF